MTDGSCDRHNAIKNKGLVVVIRKASESYQQIRKKGDKLYEQSRNHRWQWFNFIGGVEN
jgi:hypothetical protein